MPPIIKSKKFSALEFTEDDKAVLKILLLVAQAHRDTTTALAKSHELSPQQFTNFRMKIESILGK